MRRFQDSFALYPGVAAALTGRWLSTPTGGMQFLAAGGPRNGPYMHAWTNQSLTKILDARAEWFVAFRVRLSEGLLGRPIAAWSDSAAGAQLELRLTATGQLTLTRNGTVLSSTPASTIAPNVWISMQWHVRIDNSSGASELRLNGNPNSILSFTGDTQNTPNPWADQFTLYGFDFADLVINDTQGARNNSWPGDVRVDAYQPAGDGTQLGWTPSTGTRFGCVDDVQANTTDYIESSTPGDVYTAQFPALLGGAVQAVQAAFYAQKTDAGGRAVAPVFREGGQNYPGDAVYLPDTWSYISTLYEVNPATGLPWPAGYTPEFGVTTVA